METFNRELRLNGGFVKLAKASRSYRGGAVNLNGYDSSGKDKNLVILNGRTEEYVIGWRMLVRGDSEP